MDKEARLFIFMKKIFSIVLVLAAIFGIWYIFKQASNPTSTKTLSNSNQNLSHPDPSNATFVFADGPITLSKGINDQAIIPGGELTQETTLTNIIGYGDINGDNKEDTAAVLAQNGGGSGVFIYLVAYVSSPLNYKGSNAVFVGDRIEPKSISIANGIITLKYLDRKPNEPYAAEPTVLTSKQFVYTKDILSEK